MRIIQTTDGRHIGRVLLKSDGTPIETLNTGAIILVDDFTFEVQFISTLDNGNLLLSNPNYQLECGDI